MICCSCNGDIDLKVTTREMTAGALAKRKSYELQEKCDMRHELQEPKECKHFLLAFSLRQLQRSCRRTRALQASRLAHSGQQYEILEGHTFVLPALKAQMGRMAIASCNIPCPC